MIRQFIVIAALLFGTVIPAHGDGTHPQGIQLDGTLGSAGKLSLPGPDYDIKAEYGKQAGANLFHSFQQFNIHSGESAIFSGPDSVQNIISRVTGGSASWIDGKLGSGIPNADLYFLNPAGVMFGPDASLDLGGSFHVSTADYLRMGENDRFYAMPHANEVMSVAAPAAFGFLDNDNAPIIVEGRGEITAQEFGDTSAGLHVREGRTVSLIGGNIEIKKGTHYIRQKTDGDDNPVFRQERDAWTYPIYETEKDEHGNLINDEYGRPVYKLDENGSPIPVYMLDENGSRIPVMETVRSGAVTAPGGQINIASAASADEVETGPQASGSKFQVSEGGKITVSGKSLIDVSGTGAGSIFIRGGQLIARDANIQARTLEDRDGGMTDIQADTVSLADGARIIGNTQGTGKGSDIVIRAGDPCFRIREPVRPSHRGRYEQHHGIYRG